MSDQLLYRHFLDHFADAFFLHDDCGQLLDVNMQACESLGYSRDELLQLKVQSFSKNYDEQALVGLWKSVAPGFNTVVENYHTRKNGTIYPVEIKLACQLVEGRKLFYAMARDISERVRREEEIRELNIELEQRWKDSSRLLNSVMRDTPDIVFVKDLHGRYLFSNPAADKVAGFAEGTLVGKTDQDIWSGNNNFATDDARAIQSEKPIISEGYVKMDGKKCLFQSIKSPYHDENGNVIGLLGIARDITALRATEKELRTSNHFLRRAERLSRIGSWRLDLKTGEFWASEMMYEMNGADPKGPQLTPDDLRRLMPPEDHARVAAAINLCAQTGQSYALDVTHTTPDRGSFPASILGQADRDAQGNIIGISGVVQDLSEREAAKQRLEAVADNLPSGAIFRLESAGGSQRLSYISTGVEKLMGIKATAIIANQQVYLDRIHPSDIAQYKILMEEAQQQNKLFDHSFRIIRPNGVMRWLRCRSAPRHTETGTVWDGILLDISREREAEIALQQAKEAAETAERTKSEFLATMSHEIRTPMNTVIGMTRLVQQTPLSPKQRNYLDKVELSANALLSIINDILDYSKIEAGMLELESVEFALDDILETVSAVTTLKAEEKGLEIVYSVSPEVPRHLCGDPLRLSQVLNNLVSNAIKFTHQGEVV
ncbi:MAG: PAS domain S-box protein, partial [Comamonas sp.]